ncbi:MAG TPA: sterol desaturase family protein [Kiloniellales bacterium]|jgi:sterol desaturase/sphingolipid hydroxylase (fatty acid hydroxylase superfamily)
MNEVVQSLLPWKGAAGLVWLAAILVAERLVPADHEPAPVPSGPPGHWHRLARNLGLWLANIGLYPLIVLPVTFWATEHTLGWRPDWWRGGWGLALDIVLLDVLIFWWHRANHEIPILWRFHEVHHLDRFLDASSALRFHFGEVILSALVRGGLIMSFDVPITSVLVFETLVLVSTVFHHSNLALPPRLERALARLIITPSIHWVHHHARRRDTDANYGTVFSFWDPLFGTRSPTPRTLAMAIGAEGVAERPFLGLLVRPFQARVRIVPSAKESGA